MQDLDFWYSTELTYDVFLEQWLVASCDKNGNVIDGGIYSKHDKKADALHEAQGYFDSKRCQILAVHKKNGRLNHRLCDFYADDELERPASQDAAPDDDLLTVAKAYVNGTTEYRGADYEKDTLQESIYIELDINDFNFLWSTAMDAFFWDEDQAERFEIVRPDGLDPDAEIPEKSGWMMYWLGDMTSRADALLAYRIILAAGYRAFLLWDCADPEPTLVDPLYNLGWVILTDYRRDS
tara:strand:+ start:197 stop:910 length:714 start_codon:yes stop_codon:yes gene_type:complete